MNVRFGIGKSHLVIETGYLWFQSSVEMTYLQQIQFQVTIKGLPNEALLACCVNCFPCSYELEDAITWISLWLFLCYEIAVSSVHSQVSMVLYPKCSPNSCNLHVQSPTVIPLFTIPYRSTFLSRHVMSSQLTCLILA